MERLERMREIHSRLLRIAQTWAGRKEYDAELAARLRKEAVRINHAHYLENIPAYRKLAQEEGIGKLDDILPIKKYLMSTDDIFKSYNQQWLDNKEFGKMNEWLGTIFHERINLDVDGIRTIDEWIDRLSAAGITLAYSSGTTGRFSFVPRCRLSWELFTSAPTCYIAPMLLNLGLGSAIQKLLLKPAIKFIPPFTFAELVKKIGLPDYDGIFLAFRKGNMGIQLVSQEFSKKMFRNSFFLYDIPLSASAIRFITRGPVDDFDRKHLAEFAAATIGKKEENYAKIINQMKRSAAAGRKIFLFGAPYQYKELAEMIAGKEGTLPLKQGSFLLTGGGWKSFEGEKIDRESLVKIISDVFDVPRSLIVDGYSMTEINGLLVLCEHGRYHLPPVVEPVILDENLLPQEGKDLKGAFGFLDPFAISYPGFIVSGDNVRMLDEKCPCGMFGPAFTEVGRSPGREIKGCGGIMASVQA